MERLLHVNTFGRVRGGAENYIRETAAALSEFEHGLLFRRDADPAYLEPFAARRECEDLSGAAAREFLREFRPRALFLHNLAGASAEPFLALRRECGTPVIKIFHDYAMIYTGTGYNRLTLQRSRDPLGWHSLPGAVTRDAFTRRFRFDHPWRKRRLLQEMDAVDAIEVHTGDMRRTLERNGIRRPRFHLNPVWGPDPPATPPPLSARENGPVLFIGNLIRGKGLQFLLRALPKLSQPCRLVVLGDGYQRRSLEARARRCGLPVDFLGHVPKDAVGTHLASARFLVAPSVFEPFGYVLVEAMAHALPVVAFAVGGPTEIVLDGETGVLVPPFDLAMLARRMDQLLGDPELCRRLGEAGLARMQDRFTRAAHMTRTREMLADCGVAP